MLNHDTPERTAPDQIIAESVAKKPLFTHVDEYTNQTIESYSIGEFELNVLVLNEPKHGIRTVTDEVIYSGVNISKYKAVQLHDLENKELTGYQLIGTQRQMQSIKVGHGLPVCNINKSHPTAFIATDNLNLFFRLSQMNHVALFHGDVDVAFNMVNEYFSDEIPRIIATHKDLEHNSDLKIHFDADISKQTDEQIKQTLISKASTVTPSWGAIVPLGQAEQQELRPYPIHALPTIAQQAIIAIAEHVQALIAMTAHG